MESIGFLLFCIAKKNGVKIRIAHSHNSGMENTLKGFIKGILIRPYKYLSTHRFACSNSAGKFLFGKKNFIVIENAIKLEKFLYNLETRCKVRKELKLQNKFVIGHVGRFCEQKNHNFLIDVFEKVYSINNNSILILIGEGELKEKIQKKVNALNLKDNVMFLGNRRDVDELYQAMDCFVFPSKSEGFGIVLLEAQASGLNVVTSNGVPEEVVVTPNIKLLDMDIDLWVNNISELALKKEREIIDDKIKQYDIKVVANKLMQLYFELLKEVEDN